VFVAVSVFAWKIPKEVTTTVAEHQSLVMAPHRIRALMRDRLNDLSFEQKRDVL
jgi:hypothetical protein